jgi:hypothetical protein
MVIQARGKAVVQPNFACILKQHFCGQNEKKVTALPKLTSRFRDFFPLLLVGIDVYENSKGLDIIQGFQLTEQ